MNAETEINDFRVLSILLFNHNNNLGYRRKINIPTKPEFPDLAKLLTCVVRVIALKWVSLGAGGTHYRIVQNLSTSITASYLHTERSKTLLRMLLSVFWGPLQQIMSDSAAALVSKYMQNMSKCKAFLCV